MDTPRGKAGRSSKALSMDQAMGILTLMKADRMYPYIVVSLLTGLRTEEVRALRWDHLHLDTERPTVDIGPGWHMEPLFTFEPVVRQNVQ